MTSDQECLYGCHGTTAENARKIKGDAGNLFKRSSGRHGYGVYFWEKISDEDCCALAVNWVAVKAEKEKLNISKCVVLFCKIEVLSNKVLDLSGKLFKKLFIEYSKKNEKLKKPKKDSDIIETIVSDIEKELGYSFKFQVLKTNTIAPEGTIYRQHFRVISPSCYIVRDVNIITIEDEEEKWIK